MKGTKHITRFQRRKTQVAKPLVILVLRSIDWRVVQFFSIPSQSTVNKELWSKNKVLLTGLIPRTYFCFQLCAICVDTDSHQTFALWHSQDSRTYEWHYNKNQVWDSFCDVHGKLNFYDCCLRCCKIWLLTLQVSQESFVSYRRSFVAAKLKAGQRFFDLPTVRLLLRS